VSQFLLKAESGYASIQLKWNALNDTQVTGYAISRAKGSETTMSPLKEVSNSVYYDSEGLTKGESYCYQIVAKRSDGTSGETSNRACATYGQVVLWIPDTYARPGEKVIVPVNIRNANRLKIGASNIHLDYDSTVLEVDGVSQTALTEGYSWSYATLDGEGTTKRVIISSIASPPPMLHGNGSLSWITFKVKGKDGDTSPLNLREFVEGIGGSELYTPDDLRNPVPLALEDGTFHAGSAYMLGDVSGNGAVGAEDALLALDFASGKHEPTPQERSAANVNGNDSVDAGDATMILYYASHKAWPSLGKASNENVSTLSGASINLKIDNVSSAPEQTAQTVIRGTGLTNWAGSDMSIAYDTAVIEGGSFDVVKTDLTKGFSLSFNDDGKGILKLALASGTPVSGDGPIVTLTFKIKTTASSGTATLALSNAQLNDVMGRDFATSAIQQTVERTNGTISTDGSGGSTKASIYLPLVVRQ